MLNVRMAPARASVCGMFVWVIRIAATSLELRLESNNLLSRAECSDFPLVEVQ